jgi:hypothetical protein
MLLHACLVRTTRADWIFGRDSSCLLLGQTWLHDASSICDHPWIFQMGRPGGGSLIDTRAAVYSCLRQSPGTGQAPPLSRSPRHGTAPASVTGSPPAQRGPLMLDSLCFWLKSFAGFYRVVMNWSFHMYCAFEATRRGDLVNQLDPQTDDTETRNEQSQYHIE